MNFLKKLSPEWSLRIGLGIMYFYSGQDLIFHPTAWYWALPYWLKQVITRFITIDAYLKLQGIVEIIIALGLLAWFLKPSFVKWVALISAVELAGILLLTPSSQFGITFRDLGLLGASFALFLLLNSRNETV